MAEIFRKSSLEKLSSPEQLDKMIVITSPTLWLSLAGAAGIVIAALLWGIFGRLPTEVDSYGIYVNRAGVQSVYAKNGGTVSEILVAEGSEVKRGDIIALLDSKEIDNRLWEYEERIAAVEAVTMDSENDVYTLDNKSLMDIKNQMITLYSALHQDQTLLEYWIEELGIKRLEAAESEQAYLAAETEYFSSLYVGDSTPEQFDYLQSQAAFSTSESDMEGANVFLNQSELANRYHTALSQYHTDRSAVINLEDVVSQLEVQIAIDQQNIDDQLDLITRQFYAAKGSILSQLENEYEQYRQQKEQMKISASADGLISNISITQGSVLDAGCEVAKIQMGDAADSIVVCYIPVGTGKKIQEGMEVMVCPSTVNKEEYGHMKACVVSVDDYITSTENMLKQLGDNNLVESFLQNGPVVEVVCELERSEDTVSGYYWSSKKGASVVIDAGTMVEVSVITGEKAPITMLLPYLKEKLTVKAQEG